MNDESSDEDIIEIELVGHGRSRSGTDVPTGTQGEGELREGAASDRATAAGEGRRGRTAGIAAMAGVSGLVVGTLLGGGGDRSGQPEITAAPTTVDVEENPVKVTLPEPAPIVTTDVVDEDLSLASLPTPPPPDPSAEEFGTVRAMEMVEELVVDERLAGLPFEIAAVRRDGTLERLNLLTGERGVTSVSMGVNGVVASQGWVMQLGSGVSVLHSDSEGALRTLFSDDPTTFHASGSGIVWAVDDALLAGLPGEMTMLDPMGNLTERTVELPGLPVAVDRAGNWVVTLAGNTYTVTAEGTTGLLTSGSLVALGETVAIARECDEVDDCGYVTIDRETGERTPSGIPSSMAMRLATTAESISPDGRFAITLATYREPTGDGYTVFDAATLVDLDQGTTRRLTLALDKPDLDVYWTPDSSFAFFETYGVIVAFDSTTQELLDVTERPTPLPEENGYVRLDVRSADLVF